VITSPSPVFSSLFFLFRSHSPSLNKIFSALSPQNPTRTLLLPLDFFPRDRERNPYSLTPPYPLHHPSTQPISLWQAQADHNAPPRPVSRWTTRSTNRGLISPLSTQARPMAKPLAKPRHHWCSYYCPTTPLESLIPPPPAPKYWGGTLDDGSGRSSPLSDCLTSDCQTEHNP
jgi:hypothetical protein